MTRYAIVADTHWGIRNDKVAFIDNMKRFLDDVFFPAIDKEGIKHIIHLGDLVDRRKFINFETARRLRMDFIDPISRRGINLHHILGNHDVMYKNTNEVNCASELNLTNYPKYFLYKDVTEILIEDDHFLFVPWMNPENTEQALRDIKKSKANIVMGHLELAGFEMDKGNIMDHGMDPSVFDKFGYVLSGHYHHPSLRNNIHYLGAMGEYHWSDFDGERGFHIFDTEDSEMTFYKNPYPMFKKHLYFDRAATIDELMNHDFSQYKDTYVKMIIQSKENPYWFDMVADAINKAGPADMQTVEDHQHLDIDESQDIIDEGEDTLTIFKKAIDQSNIVQRDKVYSFIQDLYHEAHQTGNG